MKTIPCCPGGIIEVNDGDDWGRCRQCGENVYIGHARKSADRALADFMRALDQEGVVDSATLRSLAHSYLVDVGLA